MIRPNSSLGAPVFELRKKKIIKLLHSKKKESQTLISNCQCLPETKVTKMVKTRAYTMAFIS
jgi:hypothetical protein